LNWGAEIIPLGVNPDGFNINRDCGSTHPESLCEAVISHNADVGIALDGDADRLIMCNEKGEITDGDQLMAMIAKYWHKKGLMSGKTVVATDMSNLAFERYLETIGLKLHRAKIGDRYVAEAMRETGSNIGGEQSGHIIMSDYSTTGDGIMASLQALSVMLEEGKKFSEVSSLFTPMPQILHNIRYNLGENPLEKDAVKQAIAKAEKQLGKNGRILVRKSGTEPLIRIMVEGENEAEIQWLVQMIAEAVEGN